MYEPQDELQDSLNKIKQSPQKQEVFTQG